MAKKSKKGQDNINRYVSWRAAVNPERSGCWSTRWRVQLGFQQESPRSVY